jgi:hypothetical protein
MRVTQQGSRPGGLQIPGARPRRSVARGAPARLVTIAEQNVFVVLALAACAVIQVLAARAAIKPDSWYTLLAGRVISDSGLPHHDMLTVLAHGRSWVDQQWAGQLALYGVWKAGGWPLALLVNSACYLAAFALAAVAARVCGASERAAALVVAVCFLIGLPNTVFRTQIPAYVLFALVLLLLLTDERRPSRRAYLVFPLLVVWTNVHGSAALGAGLIALRGVTLAGALLRRRRFARGALLRAGALVLAPWPCLLASPYALDLPGYYRRVLWNPTLTHIVSEWGPSTVRSDPIFFALLLAAVWLVARARGALTPFAQLALIGSAVAGLFAIRNIVWFALVAAAVLPPALDAFWAPKASPRRRNVNLALALAGAGALVVSAGAIASHGRRWFERDYSSGAARAVAAAVAAHPGLTVFASESDADWLLFQQPRLAGRVAFDVRYELLTDRELRSLAAFFDQSGPRWQRAAAGYGLLVIDPAEGPAVGSLGGGTRVLHSDPNAIVVLRPPRQAG